MSRLIAFIVLVACVAAPHFAKAITIPTVLVGNAGNAPDDTGFGAVSYEYRIGTYEVTNAQYEGFLNAKAASDPNGLYLTSMAQGKGGIIRNGASGTYTYTTIAGRENMPVVWITWSSAMRFANWLNNGQGNGDTETGAYTMALDAANITRNSNAIWFLPSENEWYKAAYHKNDGLTNNYFDYPTSSDTIPIGEPPPGGTNSANWHSFTPLRDLTIVGAYSESASPYGTFDQGGNASELTETLTNGDFRVVRGGAWYDYWWALNTSTWFDTSWISDGGGFRVATVPEPSTIALAAFGLASLFAIAWRR